MNLTDKIRLYKNGVVDNPFQGDDKKVLFVCSAGILRSATGARLYARKYNTRSCGSYDFALIPITDLLIDWADQVVFVNKENYTRTIQNPRLRDLLENCDVRVLNIPDTHEHMAPELIKAFEDQYEKLSD